MIDHDKERHLLEVKMIVSIEAVDVDDAKDMLLDIIGTGDIEDLGFTCHSVIFEKYSAR